MTRFLTKTRLHTRICHVLAGGFQPFGDSTFPSLAFQADAAVRLGLKVALFGQTVRVDFNLGEVSPELLGLDTAEAAQ